MAIYLGGNKLQLNLGGTSIREAYLGGVKVLGEVPLPAIGAKTIRIQFTDVSYDPSISQWNDSSTWASKGWTLVKRKSSPNIWDFTHTAELPNDALYPLRSYSGGAGTHPPQAPYVVTDINTSGWTNFIGLFSGHTLLTEVPLFDISSGTIDYLFDQAQSLSNDVAWAKRLATTRAIYNLTTFITNTPNRSSIPTDFGGTKGRTVTVNPGWVTVTSSSPYSYTVSVAPGDVLTCRARNYGLIRNTRCQASWVSGSFVNNNGLPNAYVTERNTRSDPNTTFRWGYAEGSRRSVKVNGTTTNTNTNTSLYSRVAVYLESFNFL